MTYVMVDVEADGPIPGDYSMVSFGAVIVEPGLERTFFGELRPVTERWIPEALQVCGYNREETLRFPEPKGVMKAFKGWLEANIEGRPLFISDNNGFDWSFINYYFHHFLEANPFGYSSSNLGSLYKGLVRDTARNFKHLRGEALSHHPLEDAIANGRVMLALSISFPESSWFPEK